MQPRPFADRLNAAISSRGAPVVVGLDPLVDRLPPELRPQRRGAAAVAGALQRYCESVIEAVAPIVPAVKLNIAFFEAYHAPGVEAFFRTIECAHASGLLAIADIKRGDIGSTSAAYARAFLDPGAFDDLPADRLPDAVTLAGYLGEGSMRPFIELAARHGRGVYVLVRPSDPGADEVHDFGGSPRFYEHMASLVRRWGSGEGLVGESGLSCVGAVVAPKDVQSTAALRAALPQTPLLVPGYGAQGATAEACRACFLPDGRGAIVNASRSVIFAYETPQGSGRDWRSAIRLAAERFAADLAGVCGAR